MQMTVGRLGTGLVAVGALLNVFGITQLSATVEGTYANRSVDAAPGDMAVAASVDGTGWLIAGTTLMAGGGVALAASARRRLTASCQQVSALPEQLPEPVGLLVVEADPFVDLAVNSP